MQGMSLTRVGSLRCCVSRRSCPAVLGLGEQKSHYEPSQKGRQVLCLWLLAVTSNCRQAGRTTQYLVARSRPNGCGVTDGGDARQYSQSD